MIRRLCAVLAFSPAVLVRAYQPRIRPDGYGLWVEDGVVVPMFVEYDSGGEQLSVLLGKLTGYHELFATTGRVWPVLLWLHSAARERNLRRLLAETPTSSALVATGARDHAATTGLCPADAVWTTAYGGGRRYRLVDLADYVVELRQPASEAA